MNQVVIGKFIAELRKEKNLTQTELAEKLGVSNKTISKWECGKSLPDYALLEGLCMVLAVSVTEVLSGQRLSTETYHQKAEENIMGLMQEVSEKERSSKRETAVVLVGIAAVLVVAAMSMISTGGVSAIKNFMDIPTLVYFFAFFILLMFVSGNWKDFIAAFSFVLGTKSKQDEEELEHSLQAVKDAVVLLNMTGILFFVICLINVLWVYPSIGEGAAVCFATAGLNLAYAIFFSILLILLKIRLKNKIEWKK